METIDSLKQQFDVNWEKCSVGEPTGDGLCIGYEGWGEPDILVSPADPLDAQLERLGLFGQFKEVYSKGLLHRLHGDCTLTHGVIGLFRLLMPGGVLRLEYLALAEILRTAISRLDEADFVTAQILEKMCFLPPLDKSLLLFPQTLISKQKLNAIFDEIGASRLEIEKDVTDVELPLMPDLMRLGDVANEVWEASSANFMLEESLSFDRPTCVMCERVVTKRDHDRRYFSRYCKDHYHEGRVRCDEELRKAFTVIVKTTVPGA